MPTGSSRPCTRSPGSVPDCLHHRRLVFRTETSAKRECHASDWLRSARDHGKEKEENLARFLLPIFLCAQIFIESTSSWCEAGILAWIPENGCFFTVMPNESIPYLAPCLGTLSVNAALDSSCDFERWPTLSLSCCPSTP